MNEETAKVSHAGRWALWGVAVLLVYVLSIGPMSAWLVNHPPSEKEWKVIDTVYQPVVWACGKTGALLTLRHYEEWWEKRTGNPPIVFRRRPGIGEIFFDLDYKF